MRDAYVHTAVLTMTADADECAPGAAITIALCGSWQHDPPCPLAAHHTGVVRDGPRLRLRVLFAAEPADERRVRDGVDAALAAGELSGPDGVRTRWRLATSGPGVIGEDEAAHAARLVAAAATG
jgi:hypothetical protein